MNYDPFCPYHEPAKALYNAFKNEASKRKGRSIDEWLEKEAKAVWTVARDYAQQHDLPIPTLLDVKKASDNASGHADYGSKWAYYVSSILEKSV